MTNAANIPATTPRAYQRNRIRGRNVMSAIIPCAAIAGGRWNRAYVIEFRPGDLAFSAAPTIKLTPAEYLAIERKAEFKSEYYAGEMFAMAGAAFRTLR